jgi:hypothetical protein
MKPKQVLRQGVDEDAVDSGMPWRVYVVDDFAFAENDDDLDDVAEALDVFVDAPGESDEVRVSELPEVEAAIADPKARAANDDAR